MKIGVREPIITQGFDIYLSDFRTIVYGRGLKRDFEIATVWQEPRSFHATESVFMNL
jgi:hypothetical protein